MIKACLFDMDGVIVDTAGYHFKAWARLADSLSIPFTAEDNEQLKGVSRVDSLERILSWGNLVLNNEKKIQLMDLKNKWYLEYVEQVSPSEMLPGAHEFLQELKAKNIRIGLGSSSKNSMMILEKLGILPLFDCIIDGTKVHMSKPHPEVFLSGAKELGISPSEIIVFEDALSGVQAAIDGGFRCVGIGDPSVLKKAHSVVPSLENYTVSKMYSDFNESH
jgi:beta-phosphoglucomutase